MRGKYQVRCRCQPDGARWGAQTAATAAPNGDVVKVEDLG